MVLHDSNIFTDYILHTRTYLCATCFTFLIFLIIHTRICVPHAHIHTRICVPHTHIPDYTPTRHMLYFFNIPDYTHTYLCATCSYSQLYTHVTYRCGTCSYSQLYTDISVCHMLIFPVIHKRICVPHAHIPSYTQTYLCATCSYSRLYTHVSVCHMLYFIVKCLFRFPTCILCYLFLWVSRIMNSISIEQVAEQ